MLEILTFANATEAEAACARRLTQALTAGLVAASGRVSFMVSGGNTPRRVLPLVLAADLDWQRVDVFASDERLVPVDHADSTEGMVRDVFAVAGRPLTYLGFGPDTESAAALIHWQKRLKAATWPVTAAFIGIGEDAHFASLFPNRPEIADPGLFAGSVPETPPHKHARLTLGRAAFTQCELLTLVVAGKNKLRVLRLSQEAGADPVSLPSAAIGAFMPAVAFTD